MAASGGHWLKIKTGDLAGKRLFVPKGFDNETAYYAKKWGIPTATAKKLGATTLSPEAKAAKMAAKRSFGPQFEPSKSKPKPGSLEAIQKEQGQAYQAFKAKSAPKTVDMFGNTITAKPAKATTPKAPGKSQGSTSSAKTVQKKTEVEMGHGTFANAYQAAQSLSAGTGKPVAILVGEYIPAGGVAWKLQTGAGMFKGVLPNTNLYVVKTKPVKGYTPNPNNPFGDFKVTLTQYKVGG